jgi:hypothetical protein
MSFHYLDKELSQWMLIYKEYFLQFDKVIQTFLKLFQQKE